jgi:hypothetical protein
MTGVSFSRISPSCPSITSSSKPVRCFVEVGPNRARDIPCWRGKIRNTKYPSPSVRARTRTVDQT